MQKIVRFIPIFFSLFLFIQQNGLCQISTKTNAYQNPVFAHDFPDPNLVKSPDGYFYAYSTQSNWKKDSLPDSTHIIPILRSKDLVHWTYVGDVLKSKPTWKKDGGIWAPDVTLYKGKYYLYYSYSTWGDPNPGVGFAESNQPGGSFIDRGKVLFSKEVGVDNSIDPFLEVDKNKLYLVWGSFHGIYGIPLSDEGTKISGDTFRIAGNQFEGSYIYKRGNYYYYFGSTGTCCEGVKSTYKVLVGRAGSFKGPYVDKGGKPLMEGGGTVLLQGNDGSQGFVGPGHNGDIFTDDAGDTWMLYHAYDKDKGNKRMMLLDKIEWIDDWPHILNNQPSFTLHKGPVFK
ncbi:MAG: family 43 glycosylhydrolase [Bacteroidota bacterium]|nr:family 43 glycosylhydrolase [Bacteroidota bacterium]